MDDLFTTVVTEIEADARAVDVEIDEAAGGPPGETISRRLAAARQQGKWWGCIGCAALDALVQWGHCDATLDPAASTAAVWRSIGWRLATAAGALAVYFA